MIICPEKSEHLGPAVPSPSGKISGHTFTHWALTTEQLEALEYLRPGESLTYRQEREGLDWTVTVTDNLSEFVFESCGPDHSFSFRSRREYLLV